MTDKKQFNVTLPANITKAMRIKAAENSHSLADETELALRQWLQIDDDLLPARVKAAGQVA